MKLLVDKSDTVDVKVYCWEKDDEVEASHQRSEVSKEDGLVVEEVIFKFRKPNYADSNIIIRNSDLQTGDGEGIKLNVTSFQEQILRSLLIDWSIKDDGEKVILNNVSINNLAPTVARAAVSGVLDKIKI